MTAPAPSLTITGAHLAGSVPLEDAEAVFRTVAGVLGPRVRRIPDGETGERTSWINWQAAVFAGSDLFQPVGDGDDYAHLQGFALRRERTADAAFGALGYAAAAQQSYETFARLKAEGVIPDGVRFQVSLPTPVAVITAFVVPEDRAAVEPIYTRALVAEVERITASIPHDELAIQWDVAVEFAILEGVFETRWEEPEREIVQRLVALAGLVPDRVELGFHLCYGDAGHQHFVQPSDTGRLVAIANALLSHAGRPVQFLHLPVPRDRDDAAYFAPLADLALPDGTELYLGLIHMTDGADGAARRLAAASQHLDRVGIATECGFGRRAPETVEPLLELHTSVIDD